MVGSVIGTESVNSEEETRGMQDSMELEQEKCRVRKDGDDSRDFALRDVE